MQRKVRKLRKSRAKKSGFNLRCSRLHFSRHRLRVFFLLEKMKKPFQSFWASLALAGKSMLNTLLCDCATVNTPAPVYAPVTDSTHSFYTEAIADCIDFIKRSSSPMDSRYVDVR